MKNLITYLKTLWSWVADSQGNDVGYDCRLTVGSPSFDCRSAMLKLVSVLVLILTIGSGNAWGTEATFTFNTDAGLTELEITKPSSDGSGTNLSTSANYVRGNITMTVTHGSTNTRIWRTGGKNPGILDLRVYTSGGSLTFTAASGYSISGISISGSGLTNFSANSGTYSSGSWSGTATSVTFTASNTVNINTITVTYSSSCTDISPSVTYTATTLYKGATASVSNITGNTGSASVSYSSSNSTVASVNSSTGVVTAGQAGTAKITASFAATGGYCAKDVEIDFTVRYQVKWSVNGDDSYSTGSPTTYIGTHNTKVSTLPTDPGQALCDGSKYFVGWTTSTYVPYSHATTAPAVLFTSASSSPNVTDNVTYYAVFATRSGSGDPTWVQTTSVAVDDVVVIAEIDHVADGKTGKELAGWGGSTFGTGADYKTNPAGTITWTVVTGYNSTGVAFKNSSNNYLYWSSGNSLDVNSTLSANSSWSVSTESSRAKIQNNSTTTRVICWNEASPRFAAYDSKSHGDATSSGASTKFYYPVFYKQTPGYTYSNYVTSCCTPLASINGSVTYSNPTKAVVMWDALDHVAASTPYTVTYRTGSDAYGSSNVSAIRDTLSTKKYCTITGLSCNTSYDYKIAISAASGYCDKDSTMSSKNSGTWSVSSSITNGSKTSVPTTACGDYTATFAASDGYHFPAKGDITVTGASDFSWNSSTGVLSIEGEDITDNISISLTCPMDACDDYSFFYGTSKGYEDNFECFSFVTGSTDTWLTDLWTIPSADQWTYVGEPNWDPSPGKSANLQLSSMPYALNHANNLGTIGTNVMEGAQGYVKICTNSTDANRYVGFIPAGYVFRWGTDGGGWSSIAFSPNDPDDIEEEDWNTPIQTWTSSNAADFTYVGLKTSSGYVWSNRSETRRPVFFKPNANWLSPDGASKDPKFAMYYYTSDEAHKGWSAFMEDPDGDGIYEAWIPNDYDYAKVIFVRFPNSKASTGDWTDEMNQTGNLSLQSDKNVFTLAAGKWGTEADEGAWSLYDKKGKFHISANSNTNNWYCHFWPHYVLHYDANSGSGAPADQSVALDADPCQLTVSSTVPTRDGYTFLGWNESSSATTPDGDWDGGDTHAMTADVTLYAVWAANHTLSYNYNGGDGSSCVGGTKYTGQSFTACSSAGDKTGYTFTGWKDGSSNDYTAGSNYTMPDADLTLTAQWSVNSYDVTLTTNGGTINAGNVTSYTYGVGATLPTNVTRDGYRFDGWFSDDGVWSDQVTAIPTTATGDKTYYAKWTPIYTVTWKVNGSTYSGEGTGVVVGNTKVPSGEKISAVATAPADNTLNNCANKFMGWSKKSWGSTPKGTGTGEYDDLFTTVGGSPTITQDTTFYAVFAERAGAAENEVLWSENWTGATYSNGSTGMDDAKPSAQEDHSGKTAYGGATITYAQTTNGTYVRNESTGGGSAPELMIKSSEVWTVSGIPSGGATTLTVSYKQNAQSLTVAASGTSYSGSNTKSTKATQSFDVTVGSTSAFTLTFTAGSSNVRVDDIEVKVKTTSYSNYVTECAANQVRVTYDFNGGSGTACSQGVTTKNANYTVCSTEPTKTGYDFNKWSDGTNTYAAGATGYNLANSTTFTAQWTPTTYNITYELDGGTNDGDNPATYNITTETITLEAPTRDHDRFDGWFTDDGVWSDEVTEIPLGSHGDITLYAKWTERHTIVFDADGTKTTIYRAEDENMEDAVAGQGSVPSDPSAPTACSSKVFVGWSGSEIDDETDDEPADLMKPAAGTVDDDKYYYAVWAIKSGTAIAAVEDNSFTTSGTETYCGMTNGMKDAGDYILKNSIWTSSNMSNVQVKIKVYHLSNKTADVLRISLVNSSGTEVVGTDLSTTAFGTSSSSAAYSSYVTLTPTSTVTGYKVALKTKNSNGTCVDKVTREVVAIYSKYSTSCCATKVTLSDPTITDAASSGATITFNKGGSIGTCGGSKEVEATLTLPAGYQASALSFGVNSGTVSISPEISLPVTSTTIYTLTFAEDQNATLTTTATIAAKPLNSITLAETEVEIYDQQYVQIDVTYDPADILTKGYTLVASPTKVVTTGSTNTQFKISATKAGVVISSVTQETVSIQAKADNTKTASVEVTILPLPRVHFVDNVHNESFSDVVATIEDNVLSATKSTPTHVDFTGSTANTCEETHLHLVGWIDGDWPQYAAYMAGTGDKPTISAIVGASGYFYAPNADINVLTNDGKTYYAVWANVE